LPKEHFCKSTQHSNQADAPCLALPEVFIKLTFPALPHHGHHTKVMANSTDDVIRVGLARYNIAMFSSSPSHDTSDDSYFETVTHQSLSSGLPLIPMSTMPTASVISKTSTTHQSSSTIASQPARSKIFRKSNFVRRPPSPELGHGEWAIDRDARGRPIRTNRPLDASAKAQAIDSDDENEGGSSHESGDEDDEEGLSDSDVFVPEADTLRKASNARMRYKVKYLKELFPHRSIQTITKAIELWEGYTGSSHAIEYLVEYENRPVVLGKRKRSKSPPALPLDHDDGAIDFESDYTDEDTTLINEVESIVQPQAQNYFPLQLTVNIPLGQQEPIVLHIDPKSIAPAAAPTAREQAKTLVVRLPIRAHNVERASARKMAILKIFEKRVGFMDLAPGTTIHFGAFPTNGC
jgi:hypothetical protein